MAEVSEMNMNKFKILLKQCFSEFFLIFCGLVLVFFPGAAVSLGVKIVAGVLVLWGVVSIVNSLKEKREVKEWIIPVLAAILGGYMLSHPLAITNAVSRVLGLYLVIQGAGGLRKGQSRFVAALTLGAGVVLFLLPRALINTLMGAAGIVLVIIGVINLLDKLRRDRYLTGGDEKPKIIDAVTED